MPRSVFAILPLLLAVISCAHQIPRKSEFGFEYNVRYFEGEQVIMVIEEFGAPNAKFETRSGTIYQYNNPWNLTHTIATVSRNLASLDSPTFQTCRLYFGVKNDIVTHAKWKGNNCLSTPPKSVNLGVVLEKSKGDIEVKDVFWPSPAAKSDIREGDIIKKINDNPVKSIFDLRSELVNSEHDQVKLTIMRNGKQVEINVLSDQKYFNIFQYLMSSW